MIQTKTVNVFLVTDIEYQLTYFYSFEKYKRPPAGLFVPGTIVGSMNLKIQTLLDSSFVTNSINGLFLEPVSVLDDCVYACVRMLHAHVQVFVCG